MSRREGRKDRIKSNDHGEVEPMKCEVRWKKGSCHIVWDNTDDYEVEHGQIYLPKGDGEVNDGKDDSGVEEDEEGWTEENKADDNIEYKKN